MKRLGGLFKSANRLPAQGGRKFSVSQPFLTKIAQKDPIINVPPSHSFSSVAIKLGVDKEPLDAQNNLKQDEVDPQSIIDQFLKLADTAPRTIQETHVHAALQACLLQKDVQAFCSVLSKVGEKTKLRLSEPLIARDCLQMMHEAKGDRTPVITYLDVLKKVGGKYFRFSGPASSLIEQSLTIDPSNPSSLFFWNVYRCLSQYSAASSTSRPKTSNVNPQVENSSSQPRSQPETRKSNVLEIPAKTYELVLKELLNRRMSQQLISVFITMARTAGLGFKPATPTHTTLEILLEDILNRLGDESDQNRGSELYRTTGLVVETAETEKGKHVYLQMPPLEFFDGISKKYLSESILSTNADILGMVLRIMGIRVSRLGKAQSSQIFDIQSNADQLVQKFLENLGDQPDRQSDLKKVLNPYVQIRGPEFVNPLFQKFEISPNEATHKNAVKYLMFLERDFTKGISYFFNHHAEVFPDFDLCSVILRRLDRRLQNRFITQICSYHRKTPLPISVCHLFLETALRNALDYPHRAGSGMVVVQAIQDHMIFAGVKMDQEAARLITDAVFSFGSSALVFDWLLTLKKNEFRITIPSVKAYVNRKEIRARLSEETLEEMLLIFRKILELVRPSSAYPTILAAFMDVLNSGPKRQGLQEAAVKIFDAMVQSKITPNSKAYSALVCSYILLDRLDVATEILHSVEKRKRTESALVSGNALGLLFNMGATTELLTFFNRIRSIEHIPISPMAFQYAIQAAASLSSASTSAQTPPNQNQTVALNLFLESCSVFGLELPANLAGLGGGGTPPQKQEMLVGEQDKSVVFGQLFGAVLPVLLEMGVEVPSLITLIEGYILFPTVATASFSHFSKTGDQDSAHRLITKLIELMPDSRPVFEETNVVGQYLSLFNGPTKDPRVNEAYMAMKSNKVPLKYQDKGLARHVAFRVDQRPHSNGFSESDGSAGRIQTS